MAKLQQIKRANGSLVHSVNIPISGIEEISWEKGDELIIETVFISEGVYKIIITREKDDHAVIEN